MQMGIDQDDRIQQLSKEKKGKRAGCLEDTRRNTGAGLPSISPR